ncbi:pcaf-1, partial [Pristionchus pacificus]
TGLMSDRDESASPELGVVRDNSEEIEQSRGSRPAVPIEEPAASANVPAEEDDSGSDPDSSDGSDKDIMDNEQYPRDYNDDSSEDASEDPEGSGDNEERESAEEDAPEEENMEEVPYEPTGGAIEATTAETTEEPIDGDNNEEWQARKAQQQESSEEDEELGAIAEDSSSDSEIEEEFPAYSERPRLCKHLTVLVHCTVRKCTCEGFRGEFSSRRSLFHVDNGVGDLKQSAECFCCNHKLSDHFGQIRNLSVEDVDRLADIMDDVDICRDAIKHATQYVSAHMMNFYKHAVLSLRLLNPDVINDPFRTGDAIPPFEKPNVEVLMRHYLGSNTPTNAAHAAPMYVYAGRFLTEFNRWRPPFPEHHAMCHMDYAQYKDFLDKWTVHCALPEVFQCLKQHEPVLVFGLNALCMYARFLKRTAKDTEENPKRQDQMVNDPMTSMEMRHFCRGFFRYLYDQKKRSQEKLKYIKPQLPKGYQWPIWDKLDDLRGGKIGPETRMHLKDMHKTMKAIDKERNIGCIPDEIMMKTCLQLVKNERDKKEKEKDAFMTEVVRGEAARNEEREGIIRFVNVKHDLDENTARENVVWLVQLQTLFSVQLPKMPKEYITRLVFDDRHRNLALVKRNKGVIGGICYRPFKEQGFCEIVFCAITANEQVKGYGTHLMNHIKEYMAQRYEIHHLLTFADEFATGYFTKQGFTEKLGIEKEKYAGFIKEYEGATLMGCSLNADFDYSNFSGWAKTCRDLHTALFDVVYNSASSKTFSGTEKIFKEHFKHSTEPLPINKIPGLEDAKPKKSHPKAAENLETKLKNVMVKLRADPNSWPFENPVDLEEVPEYGEHIQFPIDLSTMSERISKKYYIHERLFIADLNRLFDNCYRFNGVETIYYFCAYKLNQVAIKLIKKEFPKTDLQVIIAEWEPTYND